LKKGGPYESMGHPEEAPGSVEGGHYVNAR
jgi:hypothetical protein